MCIRDGVSTPDGRQLISAGRDKVVNVWDLGGPAPRLAGTVRPLIWRGLRGAVYALGLAPRGEGGRRLLADENPVRRLPWCTVLLILACTIVYFAVQPSRDIHFSWSGVAETVSANDLRFVVDNAGIPCELVRGRPLTEAEFQRTFNDGDTEACTHASGPAHDPGKNVYLAAVLTMFLHGSIPHLFGNMLFLWVFGDNVEDAFGHAGYLVFYLVCGLGAGIGQVYADLNSALPSVGASGAIAGVLGAYLVLYPRAKVETIIPIIVIPWFVRIPAFVVMLVWFGTQVLSSNLFAVANATGGSGGVAYMAHIVGFLMGMAIALPLRGRRRRAMIWP